MIYLYLFVLVLCVACLVAGLYLEYLKWRKDVIKFLSFNYDGIDSLLERYVEQCDIPPGEVVQFLFVDEGIGFTKEIIKKEDSDG